MSELAGGVFLSVPFGPHEDWRTGARPSPYAPDSGDRFVETLGREIRLRAKSLDGARFDTVYFGGCGPTSLSLDQLYRILSALYDTIPIVPKEQSIVVLPGTVDVARAKVLLESGFDRLELRTDDPAAVRPDFTILRDANFSTVGVELKMTAELELWQTRLAQLLELEPDHVALFGPSEPGQSLEIGRQRLAAGYREYGPRHFVRDGHECRFLEAVWSTAPILGLGPGAVTRSADRIEQNDFDYEGYTASLKRNRLPLVPATPESISAYTPLA